jgi:predicted dehydrogenase
MEKIRMGLIGCGHMMGAHARAINDCTEALEITAVCDVIQERAEAVARVLGNPSIYTDYRQMADEVDAVLVALPHDLHYECGMFFARQKKHIMMEKPLCNSEEECLRLIEACEAEGVILMCAYPVRYWPGVVKLKELIDSGEYGKVFMMSIWTEQLTKYPQDHWGLTARLGGGQLFSHGCHYIDLLLWFLGQPVSGTHTGTNLGTEWMLREGTSAVTMKFASGAVAYHGATWGARGTRQGYDFQIHTEKGLLDYDHHAGVITFYSNEAVHNPGSPSRSTQEILWNQGGGEKLPQNEINHFADCVLHGKTPLTNGRAALESLRVIWKLYDAEKHNAVADLRDINPNA